MADDNEDNYQPSRRDKIQLLVGMAVISLILAGILVWVIETHPPIH